MALDINKKRNDLCHSCLHVIHFLFQAAAFSSSRKASWVTPPMASSLPTLPSSSLLFSSPAQPTPLTWTNAPGKWTKPLGRSETQCYRWNIHPHPYQRLPDLLMINLWETHKKENRWGSAEKSSLASHYPSDHTVTGKGSCCEVMPWPMFNPLHLYRD